MCRLLIFLVSFACACATAQPIAATTPPPWPTELQLVTAPHPPPQFDARDWAFDFAAPADCERGARHMQQQSRDQAWEALKGCVDRARWPRGQFTNLQLIINGAWDNDLQERPDAAKLVAHVIALRGGDVDGDLPTVQKSRVAVFTLAAAMRQPDVYKGRFVILRGNLSDLKSDRGQYTALLHESTLHASTHEFEIGSKYRTEGRSSSTYSGEAKSSNFGTFSGKAGEERRYQSESVSVGRKFENEKFITGRQALGRIPQPDPFLEPDKDFIFLARFDGVRPGSEEDSKLALVTLVTYFAPSALLME